MKPIKIQSRAWQAAPVVLAITWTVSCVNAADMPAKKDAKTEINQSTFIMPASPAQGRDPFYPESTRPYESAVTNSHAKDEVTLLEFKGFSGSADNRLAIINNHTFAVGDEEYVLTSGGRVFVRCLEIKPNSVVVEVGGQRHELSFTATK